MISCYKRQWSDVDVFRCGLYLVQFVINISQQLSAINVLMSQINMFMVGKKRVYFLNTMCRLFSVCQYISFAVLCLFLGTFCYAVATYPPGHLCVH